MRRFLSLAAVLTLAAESLAAGAATLVCRYTGRVMDDCCCQQQERTDAPGLATQDCCDVHDHSPQVVAATTEVRRSTGVTERAALDMVSAPEPVAVSWIAAALGPPPKPQPHAREPIFRSLRHLLI